MPELRLDGRPVAVPEGATLLDAARLLDIGIPTLCYLAGFPHHTSCMVCLVEDLETGALLPACATPAQPGQRIATAGPRVTAARRRSLELLLSEHAGDCEAPCTRACPAHPDLPALIRRVARGDLPGAREVMLQRLPLAGTLAAICPAPCERSCRRGRLDSPVPIRALRQAVLEARERPGFPGSGDGPGAPGSGKSAAVVGAGPAGLAAACFLARRGHRCVVLDEHPQAGGALQQLVAEGRLPAAVLAGDLAELERLGVRWRNATAVDSRMLARLRKEFDTVILAPGTPERLHALSPGERFERATTAAALPGLFACGNATRSSPSALAVQAVADGRRAALAAAAFLAGVAVTPEPRRTDSHLETRHRLLSPADLAALAAPAADLGGLPAPGAPAAVPAAPADEARRCLQCDCARKHTCRLREHADRYQARPRHFSEEDDAGEDPAPPRRPGAAGSAESETVQPGGTGSGVVEPRLVGSGGLSYDPGKCIRCGICVRIAERAGARPGLAFTARGYDLQVRVPFGEDLGQALGGAAGECARLCPTGALVRLAAPTPGGRGNGEEDP